MAHPLPIKSKQTKQTNQKQQQTNFQQGCESSYPHHCSIERIRQVRSIVCFSQAICGMPLKKKKNNNKQIMMSSHSANPPTYNLRYKFNLSSSFMNWRSICFLYCFGLVLYKLWKHSYSFLQKMIPRKKNSCNLLEYQIRSTDHDSLN